jgi:hypothetical protein
MSSGPIIDHDQNEPKIDRTPGPWRWVFPVLLAVVVVNIVTHGFDWISFAEGGALGMVFAGWAIEVTGNKVPESWKSKSASRDRDL